MTPKTIVLTGVTRGCGRALCAEFMQRGHRVLGCASSVAAIDALRAAHGPPHDFATVDVRSDTEVASWAARLLIAYGPPDLLINNAGVINRNQPLWDVTDVEFSRVMDVNVRGVANVIRRFVPAMVARKAGIVVNFSSGWGRSTDAEVAPYCASKWAIEGLTQSLAQELPGGMAAVAVNPGIIDTDMLRSCFGSSAGDYPTAGNWARSAAPFLLTLDSTVNGQQLTVPGQ